MDHRYGRHGARAWLRWYQRKQHVPPPTSLVPGTHTSVYVYTISSTERIIYIVQDNTPFSPVDGSIALQNTQNTDAMRQLHSGDEELIKDAQWQAFKDTRAVATILREEPFVRVHGPRVESIIEEIVRVYLEKTRGSEGPPSRQELDRLTSVANRAYWHRFYEDINPEQAKLIATPEEIHLRKLAVQDRKTYPTYASRQFHQRDLAVIRVISVLGLELENDECLETLHKFADSYEDYFRNPTEEVEWPEKNFRS